LKSAKQNKGNGRLTEEAFVLQAIEAGRNAQSKGIHSVYSGFNQAFRDYFGTDPVAATTRLAKAGKIVVSLRRGGAMLYKAGEEPPARSAGTELLAKMGVS